MILAEFEVFHSRPVAPTRRVAISGGRLPVEPAPGFGGLLLAGIVAAFAEQLDEETRDDLDALMTKVTNGANISQPTTSAQNVKRSYSPVPLNRTTV